MALAGPGPDGTSMEPASMAGIAVANGKTGHNIVGILSVCEIESPVHVKTVYNRRIDNGPVVGVKTADSNRHAIDTEIKVHIAGTCV